MVSKYLKLNGWLFYALLICSLNDCHSSTVNGQGYVVNGFIKGLTTDSVYLYNTLTNKKEPAAVKYGQFIFKGIIEYPEMYQIYFDSAMTQWTDIFLENSVISVTGQMDSLKGIKIQGSLSNDEFQSFRKFAKVEREAFIAADKLLTSAQDRFDFDAADSIQTIYDSSARHVFEKVLGYASAHEHSPIIPYLTHMASFNDPDKILMDKIVSLLDKRERENPRISAIYQMISDIKKTSVGTTAFDFSMTEEDGKEIRLSSFRGKVILLDFWASWCDPCIKSFPDLQEVYKKLNRDQFEIIGFSIDKNKSPWQKAVHDLNLPWPQLVETLGVEGTVPKNYGIIFLPTTYLIDKNGKIAAINLHGKKLEKKIRELINS